MAHGICRQESFGTNSSWRAVRTDKLALSESDLEAHWSDRPFRSILRGTGPRIRRGISTYASVMVNMIQDELAQGPIV
jgi:hypothetical protein